jgi:hypothetical protein
MEVIGHLHAPASLPSCEKAPCTHWIGDWVGTRAGLDVVGNRKIFCLCPEWHPGRPARSPSLYRLSGWSVWWSSFVVCHLTTLLASRLYGVADRMINECKEVGVMRIGSGNSENTCSIDTLSTTETSVTTRRHIPEANTIELWSWSSSGCDVTFKMMIRGYVWRGERAPLVRRSEKETGDPMYCDGYTSTVEWGWQMDLSRVGIKRNSVARNEGFIQH